MNLNQGQNRRAVSNCAGSETRRLILSACWAKYKTHKLVSQMHWTPLWAHRVNMSDHIDELFATTLAVVSTAFASVASSVEKGKRRLFCWLSIIEETVWPQHSPKTQKEKVGSCWCPQLNLATGSWKVMSMQHMIRLLTLGMTKIARFLPWRIEESIGLESTHVNICWANLKATGEHARLLYTALQESSKYS